MSAFIGEYNLPLSYTEARDLTIDERFGLAADAYTKITTESPSLINSPGDTIKAIKEQTGLDHETAAIVAINGAVQATRASRYLG